MTTSAWSLGPLSGPFCAFLSSATWAVGSSSYSKISRDHSPFTVNFTRAAFALPCFLLASLVAMHGFSGLAVEFARISFPQVGWLALSMFASYAFGDTLFLWSSQALGVPAALAISSIFPIWTAFLGYFAFDEGLNSLQGAGLLVAVGGVITVIMNEPRARTGNEPRARGARNNSQTVSKDSGRQVSQKMSPITRGVLIALACSLFWALNSYSVAKGGQGTSAFVGNAIRMMLALPLCCLMSAAFGARSESLLLPWRDIKRYAWVFFLETFGGSFFYFYGLSHSRLAVAATLTSLAPVLSVPVALTLKIERFSLWRTSGVCLVVIGLCLLVGAG